MISVVTAWRSSDWMLAVLARILRSWGWRRPTHFKGFADTMAAMHNRMNIKDCRRSSIYSTWWAQCWSCGWSFMNRVVLALAIQEAQWIWNYVDHQFDVCRKLKTDHCRVARWIWNPHLVRSIIEPFGFYIQQAICMQPGKCPFTSDFFDGLRSTGEYWIRYFPWC